MVEENKSNSRPHLPRGVLMKVLTFLDAAQLFKGRALQLCKKVYQESFLVREVAIRHLGLIEDYAFEQRYIEKMLGKKFSALQTTKNYDQRELAYSYMQRFARKHDKKIFLFGYQAIGGSETLLSDDPQHADDQRTVHVREQNKPDTKFNMRNVRRLFIDGDGSFNSGPLATDLDPCIVSGAFYNELDPEVSSVEELNDLFKHVRTQSEQAGFAVLRGMKEYGVSIPKDDLPSEAEQDVEMQDQIGEAEAQGGEEAKQESQILGKDLITMARNSQFNDFRTSRNIQTRCREKTLKVYKDKMVLSSLVRMLSMDSTRLVSDLRQTSSIIQYDSTMHQRLSLNNLFSFNKMHVVTKGLWAYPAKSLFVFAHNTPLSQEQLLTHPLVINLKTVKTQAQLLALDHHDLMPPAKVIDFSKLSDKFNIDLVEFQQSFYTEAFLDPEMRPSMLEPLSLRLCAFADLKNEDKMNIPFSQAFASRFISVLFTDAHDNTHLYPQEVPHQRKVDVQTIYFNGHMIPSLYAVSQQQNQS